MTEEPPESTYTPYVQRTIEEFTERQLQLAAEQERIEAALNALRAPVRRPRRRRPPAPSVKAGGRASRPPLAQDESLKERVIEEVSASPGVKVSELARRLEVNTNHLYSVTSHMASDGLIRRQALGLYPAEPA